MGAWARPYRAVFRARFHLLVQYRAAALAGFATQCWWGAIKVMVFGAFLRGAVASPMTLREATARAKQTWRSSARRSPASGVGAALRWVVTDFILARDRRNFVS